MVSLLQCSHFQESFTLTLRMRLKAVNCSTFYNVELLSWISFMKYEFIKIHLNFNQAFL